MIELLVDSSKVILPPLNIKLDLMEQWAKALNKVDRCYLYLEEKFPNVTKAKLKEAVFDGLQIRKMLRDENFVTTMNKNVKPLF